MPELGETLGRYTLLKRLAAGGMGEIYLAARMGPLGFAPPVALKVLRDELASDTQFIEMLVDEAKISMFLNHQNVVSVLDFGEDHGRYYIAMELVQGVTLKGILDGLKAKGRRLDVATSIYITNELCRALKYAHTRTNHAGEPLNIVHRDVTPANVLISVQGEVKLTDFGIARAKNRVHQTQAGVLKGKFGYMAPEMLRYETIDARADIFCAGVMLYEMLAGQHPVEGASIMDAIVRLEERDVRPPSHHNRALPRELDAIVMKALEPKPAERWSSASELAAALQELALSDATRRVELRHGSESVQALVRELFPQALEPPLPREQAEQLFAMVRQRSSVPGNEAVDFDPDHVPTGEDLAASDPVPGREFLHEPSAMAVRPAISVDHRGRSAIAELPTRDAMSGLEEGATIIPTSGRGTAATAREVEVDTDEHGKAELAAAGAVGNSQRAATIALGHHEAQQAARPNFSDNATMAFSLEREEEATGEIVIRFPESGDARRPDVWEEPSLPGNKDNTSPTPAINRAALSRAHEDERTVAQPDAFEPQGRADDGKTVAGMNVPDWDSLVPTRDRVPEVQVVDPPTALEEPVRDFAEQELPSRPPRTESNASAFDDGATAFGHNYSDDKTAFGMGAVSAEPATIIPDSELRGVTVDPADRGAQFQDDTLLDGISKDAIDKAKAELNLVSARRAHAPSAAHAPSPDVGHETRLRQEALIEEAMAEVAPQPKKISGPLKVRAPDAPAGASPVVPGSVSPSLGTPSASSGDSASPFKSRTPMPHGVRAREVPRPVVAPVPVPDPASSVGAKGPPPANAPLVGPVEIGSATGRWMRGELAANDLSWGDDAAARRAVATRNAVGGGPAPGNGTGAAVRVVPPGPPGVGQGPMPVAVPNMGPQMVGPMTGMGQVPPPYPVPNVPMPARSSRGLTLGLTMATVAVALAAVATVLLRTKLAWPELTFESTPPGATVYIDERVMAERTPASFAVRPNLPHKVELKLEGHVARDLGPGVELGFFGKRTYQVQLERINPVVHVAPVAARVFVNEALAGTGVDVTLSGLEAGEIKLRIEADGYIAWARTFGSAAEIPASMDVVLVAQPPPEPPAPSPPPRRR